MTCITFFFVVSKIVCRGTRPSDNVKHQLEVLHQLPVSLAEVISEVRLDRVDGLARDLAHKLVGNKEVPPQKLLVANRFDLHAHLTRLRGVAVMVSVDDGGE